MHLCKLASHLREQGEAVEITVWQEPFDFSWFPGELPIVNAGGNLGDVVKLDYDIIY